MNIQNILDVLSRTVYGEARNQGDIGMAAVAWVVRNRADHPRWWGHDIPSVCLCPWQFSCWNEADPNRSIIEAVNETDLAYRKAIEISRAVIGREIPDPTNDADSYFAIGSDPPPWSKLAKFVVQIGAHRFYRTELPAREVDPVVVANSFPNQADHLNEMELQHLS